MLGTSTWLKGVCRAWFARSRPIFGRVYENVAVDYDQER